MTTEDWVNPPHPASRRRRETRPAEGQASHLRALALVWRDGTVMAQSSS